MDQSLTWYFATYYRFGVSRSYSYLYLCSWFINRATVWSYLALTAQDQLRQCMAFVLPPISVFSTKGTNDRHNSEPKLQYYGMFVRNAFGSYRDILKQVAFSHSIGAMLSSVDNKPHQYIDDQGTPAYPDENFAREIMQPFSIGLVQGICYGDARRKNTE